jgi:hypothetical protein
MGNDMMVPYLAVATKRLTLEKVWDPRAEALLTGMSIYL